MKRDETYYERAWEESGEKCARAMRSLARAHFAKGRWQVAIDCFGKALSINRLYKDAWFTCGCAHMRLEQWDKAIFAFGNVVSIDETSVDAWGNIANCYHV
jgi:tetratricopeptide (TPR) repeat protein